jgi:two-component system chemotaxis response regulator CheB
MEVIGDCASGGLLRSGQPKKVLIVDDSRVMRAWLRAVLSSDHRLQIVGEAANAVEARDFIRANAVDVVTLDIEMPGMSGLEFLIRLMRARPTPVVMLSSLTSEGSDAAIQALASGAVDCMVKPTTGHDQQLSRDICERVYQAACTRPARLLASRLNAPRADAGRPPSTPPRLGACRRSALILLGSSTGGVAALETVLPDLDPGGPPVVIVQHMPGNFLKSFAERLNRKLPQRVKLAEDGLALQRGDVVLAPGNGKHTEVMRTADGWKCRFAENEPAVAHSPSVDRLFCSAVSEAASVSAAILTGLGKDGADGLLQLAKAGAATFGQDEETSVVYGMPRAAFAIGAVKRQLPIDRIGPALRACFQAGRITSRSDDRVKQP